MTTAGPKIKSRKPTGQVPWPLILLEGQEGAGKSLIPVVLSASPKVGQFYWIDLGEGAADEYASLPGAKYDVIEHDGSYRDILEQVTAIWNEAKRAHEAGEPPVGIVIDSMSAEWSMLVAWANDRAKRSKFNEKKLREDPDAEIDVSMNYWNDANARHKRIMDLLMTFPGIAVITARGKEIAALDGNGRPIPNRKDYTVEGQKGLRFDATAWIRVSREPRTSELIKVRSLRVQVPAGETVKLPTKRIGEWDVLDLEAFVFDWLGCTGESKARDFQPLRGDELEGLWDRIAATDSEAALKAVWDEVKDKLTPDQKEAVLVNVNTHLELLKASTPAQEPAEEPAAPVTDADRLREAAERTSDTRATQEVA
jgi:hypothetical protein